MYIAWTKHITDDKEKEEFRKDVIASKRVLDRLKAIIDESEQDLGRSEINPKNYEIPNWDYRQAHNNGYRASLYHIKKLIDLDQQKEFTSDR